jgi:hypothetical protein
MTSVLRIGSPPWRVSAMAALVTGCNTAQQRLRVDDVRDRAIVNHAIRTTTPAGTVGTVF